MAFLALVFTLHYIYIILVKKSFRAYVIYGQDSPNKSIKHFVKNSKIFYDKFETTPILSGSMQLVGLRHHSAM